MTPRGPTVYSTARGRVCPTCGWPADDCRCSTALALQQEPLPERVIAKLRLEKRSSGKSVTVVDGLPRNSAFLADLAKDLKRACGTGGSAGDGTVELQGDQRDRLRDLLARRNWVVKG